MSIGFPVLADSSQAKAILQIATVSFPNTFTFSVPSMERKQNNKFLDWNLNVYLASI